jgi:hypothetical protein
MGSKGQQRSAKVSKGQQSSAKVSKGQQLQILASYSFRAPLATIQAEQFLKKVDSSSIQHHSNPEEENQEISLRVEVGILAGRQLAKQESIEMFFRALKT